MGVPPPHCHWSPVVCNNLCSQPAHLWCRAIKKLTLFVQCLEIAEWLLEMSQGSSSSQGSSAVQGCCSSTIPVQKLKELSQYLFFDRQNIFVLFCFTLKQRNRSCCQTLAKKSAFDTCYAYNISAQKTKVLESSYPLFLDYSRWDAGADISEHQWRGNKMPFSCLYLNLCLCSVTLSLHASNSVACLVSRLQGFRGDLYF